jgi:hypothetical protein
MKRSSVRIAPLITDLLIVAISVTAAVMLAQSGALERLLLWVELPLPLESALAGLFFTSVFTTAPAMVALGELAQHGGSLLSVALFGALGALIGDLVIFRFVRDRLVAHATALVDCEGPMGRLCTLSEVRLFRYLSLFLGGVIIASPLPDELGLTFFGLSRVRTRYFIPLSFAFNFLGIVLIGVVARAL